MQTGQFARRTVALHLKEQFTDVFATDGSKSGVKAAYGVWEGPGALTDERVGEGRAEEEEEVEARMAMGVCTGGRCRMGGG